MGPAFFHKYHHANIYVVTPANVACTPGIRVTLFAAVSSDSL
jgi:hypothetical protein